VIIKQLVIRKYLPKCIWASVDWSVWKQIRLFNRYEGWAGKAEQQPSSLCRCLEGPLSLRGDPVRVGEAQRQLAVFGACQQESGVYISFIELSVKGSHTFR